MKNRSCRWALYGLAVAAIGLSYPARSGSQGVNGDPTQGGLAAMVPRWGWAEVISVSPKWLVLQTQDGKQFPVSLNRENVGLFVIRWPATPDQLTNQSVVEAAGGRGTNNQILTEHVDVFEGDARALLGTGWPFMMQVVGGNRISNYYDTNDLRNTAYNGYDYVARAAAAGPNVPDVMHIVAPVVAVNPLRLTLGGNNVVPIVSSTGTPTLTRITPGSHSYVRPGDLAFFLTSYPAVKGLSLSQLVVYKKMPFDQFAP
jgi:hypothetical protein